MEIDLSLSPCVTSGMCTGCGACDTFIPGQGGPSDYDPETAPEDVRNILWEDGAVTTWWTGGKLAQPTVVTFAIGGASDRVAMEEKPWTREWRDEWGVTERYENFGAGLTAAIRATAEKISASSGLKLVEVADTDIADIAWHTTFISQLQGVNPSIMPGNFDAAGTIFFNTAFRNYYETLGFRPGERGFGDLLHEFGHVLGLQHADFGRYQVAAADAHRGATVMTHREDPTGRFPTEYTRLDLTGLHYVYGTEAQELASGIARHQWVREGVRDGLVTFASDIGGPVAGLEMGPDLMIGGAGNDTLLGRGGDDILIPRGGSDFLSGGAGIDLIGLPTVSLADLTAGRVRIVSWAAENGTNSRSGIVQGTDGWLHFFEDMEGVALSDTTLFFTAAPGLSASEGAARLIQVGFGRHNKWWHDSHALPHLERGTPISYLADGYTSGKYPGLQLSTDPGAPSVTAQLWARLNPGVAVPTALELWYQRTGDLASVAEAIVLTQSINITDFSAASLPAHTTGNAVDMTLTAPLGPADHLALLFGAVLARAPTAEEVAYHLPRLQFDGVAAATIIGELARSTEFDAIARSGSAAFGHVFGSDPFANMLGRVPLDWGQARELGQRVAERLGLPHSEPEDLASRNGALGFTLGSVSTANDTVVAYRGSWEINRIWSLGGDGGFLVHTPRGQEVLLPSTVRSLKLLDGVLTFNGGPTSGEFSWTPDPAAAWAVRVYEGVLGRRPESQAVSELIRSGAVTVEKLVLIAVASEEFAANRMGTISTEQMVGLAYRQALGRDPSAWEEQAWAHELQSGTPTGALFHSLIVSPEATARYAPKAPAFLGADGDDVVFGWRGKDTLNLHGGNDQVQDTRGDDIIDGRVGIDDGTFTKHSGLAVANDFNGDGTSDVMFRNMDGSVAAWQMIGGNVNIEYGVRAMSNGFTSHDKTGDFNGDGTSDLLWRHSSGSVASWQMRGGHVEVERGLGSMDMNWKLFDTGDINADGHHDILWQHSSGFLAAWQMNDGTVQLEYGIGMMDQSRQLVGTVDINGDGDADILFRQPDGYVGVWDMQGGFRAVERGLGFLDMNWNVVGLADFTGDGIGDIMWRHATGTVVLWEMNSGGGLQSERHVDATDTAWTVAEAGDYNGDGTYDLLLRHSSGYVVEWLFNNGNVSVTRGLGSWDADWQIM